MLAKRESLPTSFKNIYAFHFSFSFLNLPLKSQEMGENLDMKTLSKASSQTFTSLFLSHMPVF